MSEEDTKAEESTPTTEETKEAEEEKAPEEEESTATFEPIVRSISIAERRTIHSERKSISLTYLTGQTRRSGGEDRNGRGGRSPKENFACVIDTCQR